MAKAEAVEGNTFSEVGVVMQVGTALNSTRWVLTYVRVERRMEVVVLREAAGEMAAWIGEPRGHAVVTWVEVAVRTIARGHDREGLAVAVGVMLGVMVVVVVQVQRLREAGEAEARGVSNSEAAVEAAAREAVAVEVVSEAEAGVEAPQTGAVLGVVEVAEVPTSAEAGEVATLRATSARSTQTQS